jgi:hypothetical protein
MTEAAQKTVPSLLGAIGKRVTIRLHEPSGGYPGYRRNFAERARVNYL